MDNKEIQASYQKNFKSSISIEYIQSDKVDYIYFNVYVSKCKLHLWHTNNPVDNVVFGFLESSSFFFFTVYSEGYKFQHIENFI